MATWEDGPEYAPLERPDQFSAPEVAPLDEAPTRATTVLDAPDDRPDFGDPDAPVPPLAELSAAAGEPARNADEPFAVATAAVTAGSSAWSAAHWSPPSGPPVQPGQPAQPGQPVPQGQWAPPTGPPAATSGPVGLGTGQRMENGPAPTQPIRLSGADRNTAASQMPQPGSNEWFGPGPAAPAPAAQPVNLSQFVTALSPVVLIFLLIGGMVRPMAAVAFIVAFSCTALIRVAAPTVRKVFIVASIAIVLITLISLLLPDPDFFGVLNQMAQIACWLVLVASSVFVVLGLRRGERPQQKAAWG
ncbi:hypothetical protein ACQBAR_03915 [Propionibacteriaceae bacterium Y1685]